MITTTEFAAMTNAQAQSALEAMTPKELVEFYNVLAVASIKKFSDKATGIKRIWKVRTDLGLTTPNNAAQLHAQETLASANAVASGKAELDKGLAEAAEAVFSERTPEQINDVNEGLRAMLFAHDFKVTGSGKYGDRYAKPGSEVTVHLDAKTGGFSIGDGKHYEGGTTVSELQALLAEYGVANEEPRDIKELYEAAKAEEAQDGVTYIHDDSAPLARPVAQNLLELVAKHGIALGGQPMTNPKTSTKVHFEVPNQGNGGETLKLTFFFNDPAKAEEFRTFAAATDGLTGVELLPIAKPTPTPVDKALGDVAKKGKKATSDKLPPKPTRKEDDSVTAVRLLTNLNPKKAGTASFDRFEAYVDGMTVAEALAAGITRADLRWDSDHKYIRLEPVASAK